MVNAAKKRCTTYTRTMVLALDEVLLVQSLEVGYMITILSGVMLR